jgi:thiamine biosynthesis lipoprotein
LKRIRSRNVRRLLGVSFSVVALAGLARPELHRFEAVEPHMGTLVRVTVYTPGEQEARAAFRAAFDRIRALDRILSDYRSDSELNEVTRTAVGRAAPVSEDLFAVLRASQRLAEATGGAFDVTLGPVIGLWREARKTARMPDPAALQAAAARSGFRKLHLDPARRTVRFDMAGMALDVGAIGKGYAASEAIEVLTACGIRSALVAVSGDLAFSDAPPGQRGWRIRVHSGAPEFARVPGTLELTHAAVSTAGSSEQYANVNGRRYSHIIDPASAMGLVDDVTVTVIARDGLEADGLDTASSILGAARGLALIESIPDAAALIVQRSPAGTTVLPSSRFLELASKGVRPGSDRGQTGVELGSNQTGSNQSLTPRSGPIPKCD